ncbi:MAG: PhnA domain-containing protein [Ferruginibacter sp.]|nr:PhnA domain-containing protein [Ferruginibacter sp.]
MTLEERLFARSENKCELCASRTNLSIYELTPTTGSTGENSIVVCEKCLNQLQKKEEPDSKHWACLTTSMWSEVPAVQVVAWRMLNRLRDENWAADNLDMMFLDEALLTEAKLTGDHEGDAQVDLHKDANGNLLHTGDTVILTKSLDVKGSTLNAKMGSVLKNIRLVEENTEQVEAKVEGQVIVILTKYLRKQG